MNEQIVRLTKIVKIINVMFVMMKIYLLASQRLKRRWWIRPVNLTRNNLSFHHTCFAQLKLKDEEHFFKATRMNIEKFKVLLTLLRGRLQRFSKREPINEETRLGITLIYLSQGCSPQYLAWSYKMGLSTVRKIIYETCDAIWQELHEIYLAQPNQTEWKNIADRFYVKTGMPHCLGAVDGKHIKVICPKSSGSLYYNFKKTFSIVLMAICDQNYSFVFVDVGALGSQSDGGIFARSAFGRMILRNQLEIPPDDNLPGTDKIFPYFFVGDNAFPLRRNLMRPYPGRNLSTGKLYFNKKLSSARVHIENTFGILANRWRILHTTINAAPVNVDKIVLATVVLHNYLMLDRNGGYFDPSLVDREENGIFTPGTWRQSSTDMRSIRISHSNRSTMEAFTLREELTDYLLDNNGA
ncbi:protein ALP1-like [Rhagoletis pomonella]|uniref:protein ALP1-like n=1 Tax=Rhagoletis pomonella TaxID=28610 RepID=UPI00177C16CE|nr:protein ALP1-like [Rhagoletis pomonella]